MVMHSDEETLQMHSTCQTQSKMQHLMFDVDLVCCKLNCSFVRQFWDAFGSQRQAANKVFAAVSFLLSAVGVDAHVVPAALADPLALHSQGL